VCLKDEYWYGEEYRATITLDMATGTPSLTPLSLPPTICETPQSSIKWENQCLGKGWTLERKRELYVKDMSELYFICTQIIFAQIKYSLAYRVV
jgi:hypothetical protein